MAGKQLEMKGEGIPCQKIANLFRIQLDDIGNDQNRIPRLLIGNHFLAAASFDLLLLNFNSSLKVLLSIFLEIVYNNNQHRLKLESYMLSKIYPLGR